MYPAARRNKLAIQGCVHMQGVAQRSMAYSRWAHLGQKLGGDAVSGDPRLLHIRPLQWNQMHVPLKALAWQDKGAR